MLPEGDGQSQFTQGDVRDGAGTMCATAQGHGIRMGRNALGRETSPYLLQHADNPVDWRPWGRAALDEAQAGNKPILLSVGYAACHWCHVMAHESFEDEATARVMNELFVNIKVDREERPDIDAIYQASLALLGQQGGWPLTMFCTPKGEPFWGGTYFPNDARFGRPQFTVVLREMARLFAQEPDGIAKNTAAILGALGKMSRPKAGGPVSRAILDRIAQHLAREVDTVEGGMRGAPKFPQSSIFKQLWRAYRRSRDTSQRELVTVTLDRMAQGGIYDHLGGGFARYSVDAVWLVPHFEKMLYDNAQLIELFTMVWQETRSTLYAARVAETVGWVLREMINPDAPAFCATIDADSEGEEGRFYVWDEAEIDALLGSDAAPFKRTYDVTHGGNWEGKTILNRRKAARLGDAEDEARLAQCRAKLLAARDRRVKPARDDKVLADWNGMMIAALAEAGRCFDRPEWLAAARASFDFVAAHMQTDGRLGHSWRMGRLKHAGTLDDHAHMIRAALALYEAEGKPADLAQAIAWTDQVERHFRDGEAGGYFFTADDARDLIARTKTAIDNATPSGNGTMAEVQARLFYLTGDDRARARAQATIAAFSGELSRNFLPYATLLNAGELLDDALQVVVAGTRGAGVDTLLRSVYGATLPNRVLQVVGPDDQLPDGHPANGKGMIDGAPTVYLCQGPVCSPPLTDPVTLAVELAKR